MKRYLIIIIIALLIVGCGTITNKNIEQVRLQSNPTGASYKIYTINDTEIITNTATAKLYRFGLEITDRFFVLYNSNGTIHSNAERNPAGYYTFSGSENPITSDMFLYDQTANLIEIRLNNAQSFFTPTTIKWEDNYHKITFTHRDYPSQSATLKKSPSFLAWATPLLFTGVGAAVYRANDGRVMPKTKEEIPSAKSTNDKNANAQYAGLGLMAIGAGSLLVDMFTGNLQTESSTIAVDFRQSTSSKTNYIASQNINIVIETLLKQATTALSNQSRIAILDISIEDPETRAYVNGEVEYILVKDGYKVVDREQLDIIRDELKLQRSGEIDDDTAVSVGKFAGADYILTGGIDGEGSTRRIRFRILDTTSGLLIDHVSSPFQNHEQITDIIGIERAIPMAINQAAQYVSKNAKIALVDVDAPASIKDYIMGETEFFLVNSGYTVIDRSELDRVREEQALRRSQEMQVGITTDFYNLTVAATSHLAGAQHIITIKADGQGDMRRLRLRILDTESALVMGVASIHYSGFEGNTSTQTIERANEISIYHLVQSINPQAVVAIVQISGLNNNQRDYIAGETEVLLRNKNFTIVDRAQLDTIRREQGFQLSGEVDDRTIVSIGRLTNAEYIITGKIDGTDALRRLRFRVIDTREALVKSVSSVRF